MNAKVVSYECCFAGTKAGYERFGRAVVEHHIKVVDSYRLNATPPSDVVVLVRGALKDLDAFGEAVKGSHFKYRSPTIFDNGTLVPIYAGPEDEIAGKKTGRALGLQAMLETNEKEEAQAALGKEVRDALSENDEVLDGNR